MFTEMAPYSYLVCRKSYIHDVREMTFFVCMHAFFDTVQGEAMCKSKVKQALLKQFCKRFRVVEDRA